MSIWRNWISVNSRVNIFSAAILFFHTGIWPNGNLDSFTCRHPLLLLSSSTWRYSTGRLVQITVNPCNAVCSTWTAVHFRSMVVLVLCVFLWGFFGTQSQKQIIGPKTQSDSPRCNHPSIQLILDRSINFNTDMHRGHRLLNDCLIALL